MKTRKQLKQGGSFGSPFFGNLRLRLSALAGCGAAFAIALLIRLQGAARLLPFLPALWLD
ncbi:MAG: hypothetical protein U1B83_08430 [Candidatus Cloacimonadaceae bacterium]|nr:hypothetical protein [Candidatus Cloacimonadaceae bacterium]